MVEVNLKRLFGILNPYTKRALETAAGLSVSRGNYEVAIEHVLLVLIDDAGRDLSLILRHFEVEAEPLKSALLRQVEVMKSGNPGRPVFASTLVEWLTDAWLVASVDLGLANVRSGALIAAALANGGRYGLADWFERLSAVSVADLKAKFTTIVAGSTEDSSGSTASGSRTGQGQPADKGDGALAKYSINFTELARAGKIDPVFGRDREIRQMIDILGRRRKNNPICVGDPGVGKTAVVEGLALKIAEGDVPDFLKTVDLLSLDLGALQAGASVKGEFENRLKSLIDEVKSSVKPIVLFIDEAHTLVGAGGAAGGGDAANLLKPALARGELRTVAATTWSEYKKYFEKDPALARRFQLVKLDEPSPLEAVTIIRGLRSAYERSHSVYIRDDAVAAAATLSARYISGRQLPDKAVDVLDTACARVRLSLSTRPPVIEDLERSIATLKRERDSLERDLSHAGRSGEARIREIDGEIVAIEGQLEAANAQWLKEKTLVDEIVALRTELGWGAGKAELEAPVEHHEALEAQVKVKSAELDHVRGRVPLVQYEVTPATVGQVIADWTGIPVGNMVEDEAAAILGMAAKLRGSLKGQDHAIEALDLGMRAAKAGVNNPGQPMGVFLFVGPSGVGKTELATQLSSLLFGGERFLISINMSEFQEKHTVSKLVGAPAGYVGFGEGGVLTEAVRQRPYSVVLLDEVEKADLEVLNLFYQVFDKGTLSDGEGRIVDFKNTIVILTSNLATDVITQLGMQAERPSVSDIVDAIRPILSAHFRPALLARMDIVPFFPLLPNALSGIVRLKLDKVGQRLRTNQKIDFSYTDAVVDEITARCTEVETGARNIDHIVNKTLLPEIATEILLRMEAGEPLTRMSISLGADGAFVYNHDGMAAEEPQQVAA